MSTSGSRPILNPIYSTKCDYIKSTIGHKLAVIKPTGSHWKGRIDFEGKQSDVLCLWNESFQVSVNMKVVNLSEWAYLQMFIDYRQANIDIPNIFKGLGKIYYPQGAIFHTVNRDSHQN